MISSRRVAAVGAAFVATCFLATSPAPSGTATQDVAATAAAGRVLTKSELRALFSGRTWYWKDGAAYFRSNRMFEAWVKGGAETTYGEGSWTVDDDGQLCIRAIWHSLSEDTKAFTCYVHRINKAIYQRELPRGSWYLFSHIPVQPGDEASKLEQGDHVTSEYLRAKRYVIRNMRGERARVPGGQPNKPR